MAVKKLKNPAEFSVSQTPTFQINRFPISGSIPEMVYNPRPVGI